MQWSTQPEIDVLNLRGRLENCGSPTYRSTVSWIASVASMTSSASTPASGQPRITRGVSPQASVLPSPTASSRRQISGTSSIRIQWYWTFCRSVMSATSRPNSVLIPPMTRRASLVSRPPSMRTRSMKYLSSSSSGSSTAVLPPGMPWARWV